MTSVHPLIGSTVSELSISSALCGIGGSVLCIMAQVPSNRSQHVVPDGCRGKLVNVATEVPQGSVEGL